MVEGVSDHCWQQTTSLIGGVAQLARAPALHAGGHRFESVRLHKSSLNAAFWIRKPDVTQVFSCGLGFAIRTSTISLGRDSSLTYWENKSCKPSNFFSSGNTTQFQFF